MSLREIPSVFHRIRDVSHMNKYNVQLHSKTDVTRAICLSITHRLCPFEILLDVAHFQIATVPKQAKVYVLLTYQCSASVGQPMNCAFHLSTSLVPLMLIFTANTMG